MIPELSHHIRLSDAAIAAKLAQHCVDTLRFHKNLKSVDPVRAAKIDALRVRRSDVSTRQRTS